jgi:hypothetical protein
MRKKVWLPLFLVLLAGCASGGKPDGKGVGKAAATDFNIKVENNSRFDIELIDHKRVVPAHAEKTLTLPRYMGEVDGGYSLDYRVNLLDGVLRKENVVVKPEQKVLVIENAEFTVPKTFIVVQNESVHTVKLRSDTGYRLSLEQDGDGGLQYGAVYIASGASALFDKIPSSIKLSVESDSYLPVPFPFIIYRPGFRCLFAFDGTEVKLTDARPLYAIGEPAKVQTLPALPETVEEAIKEGLARPKGCLHWEINVIAPRDDGVFLAAGEAHMRKEGPGRKIRTYLCEAKKTGSGGYDILWERLLGGDDSDLGPAYSAYYDKDRKVYHVVGKLWKNNGKEETSASYLIEIKVEMDEAGKYVPTVNNLLQREGFTPTKVVGDAAGNAYLAGRKTVEAGGNVAMLVKYSKEGIVREAPRTSFPYNSYYQDALFNKDENQIVLVGVQNMKKPDSGGTPFIQGINAETGKAVWYSELTEYPFRGVTLDYRIERTNSGYRVMLGSISGGKQSYLEAALNVRGRFVKK